MADQVLTRDGPVSVPMDYVVPQGGELLPLAVRATLDGTSAASSFYATVQVIAPSGRVMGNAVSTTIAAGASADVTWFPGGLTIDAAAVSFVGARLDLTTPQVIPDSTPSDMHYQVVTFDTGGMANLGSNDRILTAQTAGLYLVINEIDWPWTSGAPANRESSSTFNSYVSQGTGHFTVVADDQRSAVWAPLAGPGPIPHTTTTSVGLWQANAGDFFATGGSQTSGAGLAVTGASFMAILLGGN